MRYALLVRADESAQIRNEERARRDALFTRFCDQMRDNSFVDAGERLDSAENAATVRCWEGGDVMVTDGPSAEIKEQVVGFFLVDCKDMDAAIEVATSVPVAWYGAVEVRQICEP